MFKKCDWMFRCCKRKTKKGVEVIPLKKEKRKPFRITSPMIPDTQETLLVQTLMQEIFQLLMFTIVVAFISMVMTSKSTYSLCRSLQNALLKTKFKNPGGATITFYDIKTAVDFWAFSETVLPNALHFEKWYDDANPIGNVSRVDNNMLIENNYLGLGRIRQLKVRNDSCDIHDYMVRNFQLCFSLYSAWAEDKTPFGRARGNAWTYNTPEATGSIRYYGLLGIYEGGGYYSLLGSLRSETTAAVEDLKQHFWLTKATRMIVYEFSIFNANVNLFSTVKVAFEFPPTGGILPSASFKTVYLLRYSGVLGYFILAFEAIFVFLVFIQTVEEIEEIIFFRRKYLTMFWNCVDLAILLFSYITIVFAILRYFCVKDTMDKFKTVLEDYGNFERATDLAVTCDYLLAIVLFLLLVKIFKFFEFSDTMGQLNRTLEKCSGRIFGFSVMFFIIFLAYAELGYLIFGSQVKGFCGFFTSMITLVRTIMGDFNYLELEQVDRIYAPIFFISYIFIVFFILMNMFIAIVNDSYAEVKVKMAVTIKDKRSELLTRAVYQILMKIHCQFCVPRSIRDPKHHYTSVNSVESTLRSCGFSEDDVRAVVTKCGADFLQKSAELDVVQLMGDLDTKQYQVPPAPEIPQKATAGSKASPIILEDEFQEQNRKIADLNKILVELTNKVESLLKELSNASRTPEVD